MLEWLEIPKNFWLSNGRGNMRGRVGQQVWTKKTVFAQMLIVLHGSRFPRQVTNDKNLWKHYAHYKKHYQEALVMKQDSRGGLTDLDIDQGMKIEDKLKKYYLHLESVCMPCWVRGLT